MFLFGITNMRKVIEILILDGQDEYRKEYENVFVNGFFALRGVKVIFDPKGFDHIFFEPMIDNKGCQFSFRRAKKLYFIKEVLSGDLPVEILFEESTKNIAVFCREIDCVVYLRPTPNGFQVMTFFDFGKDHTKMYQKQRNKCREISDEEFKEITNQ